MLDDENDKRIQEAADQYHPEYDDMAWKKMEQLLDEHLPVEKEKKRFLFLILLLLFIGCFLFLFLYTLNNDKTGAPEFLVSKNEMGKAVDTNSVNISKANMPQHFVPNNISLATITKIKKGVEKNDRKLFEEKSKIIKPITTSVIEQRRNVISDFKNDLAIKQSKNNQEEINSQDRSNTTKSIEANKYNTDILPKENVTVKGDSLDQKKTIAKNNMVITEQKPSLNTGKKTRKSGGGFANNFGVNISAGPDISDVYRNTIGKLTVAYGAGLSYDISKRLNIRTGFYLSKKIYSVAGGDYKMPAGSTGNYEYLQNVEANCKVYEIPVKLDYTFGKIKNHSWFVSAGLSSYLMKKESYDYYYKTPSGEIYNKDWSISNKNKHFFSVLDISGGYQYSFNPQFSLIAEPYVNLPLTGIGAGKVKLNSGGILFTIKAKPFLKRKSKLN